MAQCTLPGQRTARPGGVRLGYTGLGRSEYPQTVPERASEKFAPFPWRTKTALIYFPHSDLEGKAVEENDRGDAYMDHMHVVYYYMILISYIFTSCIFFKMYHMFFYSLKVYSLHLGSLLVCNILWTLTNVE